MSTPTADDPAVDNSAKTRMLKALGSSHMLLEYAAAGYFGNNAEFWEERVLESARRLADALGFDMVRREPAAETGPIVAGAELEAV